MQFAKFRFALIFHQLTDGSFNTVQFDKVDTWSKPFDIHGRIKP